MKNELLEVSKRKTLKVLKNRLDSAVEFFEVESQTIIRESLLKRNCIV